MKYLIYVLGFIFFLGCQNSDKPRIKDVAYFESYPLVSKFGGETIMGDPVFGITNYLEIEVCYPGASETRTIENRYTPWVLEENGTYKVVILTDSENPVVKKKGPLAIASPDSNEWIKKLSNYEIYDKVLFSAKVPILVKDKYYSKKDENDKLVYYREAFQKEPKN
ncbi:hypothetical protein INQ51_12885 [Maribellus sp. CM-23]|uniref:hypothetical protein n=1 Tax=Maribellus sp. CM-23 TaxID=2781026 RepID=UPI001F1CA6DB|nr:hypothetical protein [Maribellus sp. CM-23]MCE4565206.1 hypothetical protein [Maribellus sp. CM-23]